MNTNFFIFLFLIIGFYSCAKDDDIKEVDFFESLSADTLWYGQTEASQSLELKASASVEAIVPEEASSWCSAEITAAGGGQAVTLHCGPNDKVEARYTTVVLKTPRIEQKLVICQYGIEPIIKVVKSVYELSTDSTIVNVPVISNVEYEVIPGESWIHYVGTTKGLNVDTVKLGLSASIYPRRSGDVLLKWNNLSGTISMTQISADTIYQDGSEFLGKIKVERGAVSHESPGMKFSNTYDGTSAYYGAGWVQKTENITMTWFFEKAEELERMDYTPYEDAGPSRSIGQFYLAVREEGSSEFKELGKMDFQQKLTNSSVTFDQNLKKIDAVQIRVLPPAAEGQWTSYCQEMEFWVKGSDVTSIFTDELCSDLKKGVTYEQIMAMKDDFYRNIARHLYMGTYDTKFRVQSYQPYINPDVQKGVHKAFAWSFLDNPTGISVKEGEQMVVFVGDINDEEVKMAIVDWNKATYKNLKPQIASITLKKGVNVFTADKSGLLYVVYNLNNLVNKKPIKIHIPSGEVNGYFDVANHDEQYWKSLLNNANNQFLDVKGKLVHLVFPTDDFRRYRPDNIGRLLEVYDSIVLLEHELSGLYKYNQMYPNRILCKVTYESNYFMYAYDYQTAYNQQTAVPAILNAEQLRKSGWGVYHELGHVHQNRNITWCGMTEVSNNVFALFVQATFGSTSRLIEEQRYQEAYDFIAVPGNPHGLAGRNNPFAKVVPLWQLQLYFAKVLNKPEFYMDLYNRLRQESTPSCPQLNFVELCCQLGGIDFTDFFRFFGFFTPINANIEDYDNPDWLIITQDEIDGTLRKIASMQLQKTPPVIQYLRDDNVALFKNMKQVEVGRVALSGSALTLSEWKNVVAWEVYDGVQLIQVAIKESFELKNTGSSITVKAVAADGTRVNVVFP